MWTPGLSPLSVCLASVNRVMTSTRSSDQAKYRRPSLSIYYQFLKMLCRVNVQTSEAQIPLCEMG